MKRKSAFSLLELIVVIAIIATIIGIGFTTFSRLRNREIARGAVDEFIGQFNDARNRARNGVVDNIIVGEVTTAQIVARIDQIDYHAIVVDVSADNYFAVTCDENPASGTRSVCTARDRPLKSDRFAEVEIRASQPTCEVMAASLSSAQVNLFDLEGNELGTAHPTGAGAENCVYNFIYPPGSPTAVTFEASLDRRSGSFDVTWR